MFAHIFKGPSERPLHATTTSAIRSKPIAPVSDARGQPWRPTCERTYITTAADYIGSTTGTSLRGATTGDLLVARFCLNSCIHSGLRQRFRPPFFCLLRCVAPCCADGEERSPDRYNRRAEYL